jgi:hypothetical protein
MLSPGLSTSDVSGKRMPMNLREGVRRLALLLGAVGAIFAAFASCVELRTVLKQTLRHNRFEQLANSQAVQDSRNCWKGVLSEPGRRGTPAWSHKRTDGLECGFPQLSGHRASRRANKRFPNIHEQGANRECAPKGIPIWERSCPTRAAHKGPLGRISTIGRRSR